MGDDLEHCQPTKQRNNLASGGPQLIWVFLIPVIFGGKQQKYSSDPKYCQPQACPAERLNPPAGDASS